MEVLAPSARQYTATGLKPESVYLFRITAQTRKGWGEAAEALVVTTEKRGDRFLGLGRPGGQPAQSGEEGVPAKPGAPALCSRGPGDQPVTSHIALPWNGRRVAVSEVGVSKHLVDSRSRAGRPRPEDPALPQLLGF